MGGQCWGDEPTSVCCAVLLTVEHNARIGDLGLATYSDNCEGTATQTHIGGTAGYKAPEIVTKKFSTKADIFSMAVMYFEMATGEMPDISSSHPLAPLRARKDPVTHELLRFMLKLNSNERPSAVEALGRIKQARAFAGASGGDCNDPCCGKSPPLEV